MDEIKTIREALESINALRRADYYIAPSLARVALAALAPHAPESEDDRARHDRECYYAAKEGRPMPSRPAPEEPEHFPRIQDTPEWKAAMGEPAPEEP